MGQRHSWKDNFTTLWLLTSPLDLAFLGLLHYPVRKKEKMCVTWRVIIVFNYIFFYFYFFTIANHAHGKMCMLMVIFSITPTVVNLTFDPLSPGNP